MADILEIRSGADFEAQVDIDNGAATPVAINLTGYTLEAEIRHATGTQACAIAAIDLTLGRFRISLDETETAALPLGQVSTLRISYTSPSGFTEWDECTVRVS